MVDNNDDIESEDDNDSADAAEADGSPEEADTDNPLPDTDPLLTSTRSPQGTPSSGAHRTTDACCRQREGGVGDSGIEDKISLVIPKHRGGGDAGGDRDSGTFAGGSANVTETNSTGAAGGIQPNIQHSVIVNDSGGGGEGRDGADGENNNTPWTDIEWGQGEGESGGAVRRWGRAVQEGEDCGSTGTITSAGEVELPPTAGETVAEERRKEGRESPSLDRGISPIDLAGERGTHEMTTSTVKGAAGEPPPRSGGRSKKERRRTSGSRAPKALVLSNGTPQNGCWSVRLGGRKHCRHTSCLACAGNFLSCTCR